MSVIDDVVGLLSKLAPDVVRELFKVVSTIFSAPESERLELAKRIAKAAAAGVAAEEAAKKALGRDDL